MLATGEKDHLREKILNVVQAWLLLILVCNFIPVSSGL